MPGGDGTGPLGSGPMTGKGFGFCTGYDRSGYASPRFGHAWIGRGRGWNRGFYGRTAWGLVQNYASQVSYADELDGLKSEADILKEELKSIEVRIQELKGSKSKK